MIVESIVLPFIGSREEDQVTFQYLLQDVGPDRAQIALPQWVVSRERLREGDLIHFHLPFLVDGSLFSRGKIDAVRMDEDLPGQICTAGILPSPEAAPPMIYIHIAPEGAHIDLTSFHAPAEILPRIVKDALLLKKGILIYLNHLIPYFSRIGGYPEKEYPLLREALLEDIRKRVAENAAKIEFLLECANRHCPDLKQLSKFLDLEQIRAMMESEIYSELFRTTFADERVTAYIDAIKNLEKKLYTHYNLLVMLYVKSL
jgi:hypothetical protein